MHVVGKILALIIMVPGCVTEPTPSSQREGIGHVAKGLAIAKSYPLNSAKSRAVWGSSEIPVRAKSWTLRVQTLERLDVAAVDASALPGALADLVGLMRPALAAQAKTTAAVDRSDAFHLSVGSLRGWAHKQSGFLSLIDTERVSTGPRRIFSAPQAVEAILEQLDGLGVFGLQSGQTIDVVAVKETRGSMVDAKTYQQVLVRFPGESEPAESHTVSYRVIFGHRQDGVPIQHSAFAASVTPQGRLIELSRLWRAVSASGKMVGLASMPGGIDAWVRQGLTARGVAARANFERRGCGYLEGPMTAQLSSLEIVCHVIVKDPGAPSGRLIALPLAGQ